MILQVQTVKPVYKDHIRDQVITVSVDRCSLCGGAIVLPERFTDQRVVVSINRWSSYTSGFTVTYTVSSS